MKLRNMNAYVTEEKNITIELAARHASLSVSGFGIA